MVRVKSTGGKTYLSKKYKVSLKNILKKYKVKVKVLLSVACRGGGGDFSNGLTYKRHKTAHALYACTEYTIWSLRMSDGDVRTTAKETV